MNGSACASTKGDCEISKIWVLRDPLIRLARAHAPSQDAARMANSQTFGNEPMLGRYVIANSHIGERAERFAGRVRRTAGLAVAKHGRDNDVVFLGIERLVFTHKPLVVRDGAAEPGRINDCWVGRVANGLVRDEGIGDSFTTDELEITQLIGFVVGTHFEKFLVLLSWKVNTLRFGVL